MCSVVHTSDMYAVHFVDMYFTSHQLYNGKLLHFDDEVLDLAHETLTCLAKLQSIEYSRVLNNRFVHVHLAAGAAW